MDVETYPPENPRRVFATTAPIFPHMQSRHTIEAAIYPTVSRFMPLNDMKIPNQRRDAHKKITSSRLYRGSSSIFSAISPRGTTTHQDAFTYIFLSDSKRPNIVVGGGQRQEDGDAEEECNREIIKGAP